MKHYRHQGETGLQLLRLDRGWVFTARHVSQGVENVTCRAHPGERMKVKDLGTPGHGWRPSGVAKGMTLQRNEVDRSCVTHSQILRVGQKAVVSGAEWM